MILIVRKIAKNTRVHSESFYKCLDDFTKINLIEDSIRSIILSVSSKEYVAIPKDTVYTGK